MIVFVIKTPAGKILPDTTRATSAKAITAYVSARKRGKKPLSWAALKQAGFTAVKASLVSCVNWFDR